VNIDEAAQKLSRLGVDWADKRAAARLLEETRKSQLARIMRNCAEGSQAAKETFALSTIEYQEHVEAMIEAGKQMDKARVAYESMRVWCDLYRTERATQRAEMENISG
jgi:hypothetical protein